MITTLIPAYKTEFLKDLFLGLKAQVFKQFKVIVSDDSPNNQVTAVLKSAEMQPYVSGIDLEIIEGPKKGATANINHLTKYWGYKTPYVHLLLDDDIIYPLFYQLHLLAHQKENVGASASFRWIGNQFGAPVATKPVPLFISQSTERVDLVNSDQLFATTIPNTRNWLGETSNVLFTAESYKYFEETQMNGLNYYGLRDMGVYLQTSLTKNIAVIKDHLSVFRVHAGQDTGDLNSTTFQGAHIAWIVLALIGLEQKKLTLEQARNGVTYICDVKIVRRFQNNPTMMAFANLHHNYDVGSNSYKTEFLKLWNAYLSNLNN
jgi:hypothetical protein